LIAQRVGRLPHADRLFPTLRGIKEFTAPMLRNQNAADPPKPEQPPTPPPAQRSGEGADSALEALKRHRVPAPKPPRDTPAN
jgi:hypothetical protein